jgi:hypothetical protein
MTKAKAWKELRDSFLRKVREIGPEEMAKQIPAHRATVYRLLKRTAVNPSLSIRARIEQIVEEKKQ